MGLKLTTEKASTDYKSEMLTSGPHRNVLKVV